jgi:signal peptidase I
VVRDESMLPTLRPGDRLLVDTAAFRARPPAVGDIVVFVDPTEPRRWLIKRISAVGGGPGSSSRQDPGSPAKAGKPFPAPPSPTDPIVVPEGTVYVVGDARSGARDSHAFGPVRLDAIVGRAYRCYAPTERRRELE